MQDWDREHLNTEDRQVRLGPGGVHPRVLRQLAEVAVGPLWEDTAARGGC